MGSVQTPESVKLFTGIFSRDPGVFPVIQKRLERTFGKIDFQSPIISFAHTDYYREEFGDDLKRQFFTFQKPASPEGMYKVKLITNRLEARYAKQGKRTVNIDPGYVALSKVVLLTTKDFTHRLYLAKGIYAEVTLFFQNKTFNPWPWTYPDYKTKGYIDLFNAMRQRFHQEEGLSC
jgi:hypothetical protein